jgi:hypothetical protein
VSLLLLFQGAVAPPTDVVRYVNTASTAGGDGTTNATVGANRAFATLNAALAALEGTDWAAANERPVILCSGVAADTTPVAVGSGWAGNLSAACYLEITTDQPSALATSTAHYRLETTDAVGFGTNSGGGPEFMRVTGLHLLATYGAGAGGSVGIGLNTPSTPVTNADIRFIACRSQCVSMSAGRTSAVHGFWTDFAGGTNDISFVNCVALGWIGGGSTHFGFTQTGSGDADTVWYNCTSYGNGVGYGGNGGVRKNCGAAACTTATLGTFGGASTNNSSATPTFVNAAGGDLHLSPSDTTWKDQGADLSADTRFAFSTDGDGATRSGTWDIGADEAVVLAEITAEGAVSVTLGATATATVEVAASGGVTTTFGAIGTAAVEVAASGGVSVTLGVSGAATTQPEILAEGGVSVALGASGTATVEDTPEPPTGGGGIGLIGIDRVVRVRDDDDRRRRLRRRVRRLRRALEQERERAERAEAEVERVRAVTVAEVVTTEAPTAEVAEPTPPAPMQPEAPRAPARSTETVLRELRDILTPEPEAEPEAPTEEPEPTEPATTAEVVIGEPTPEAPIRIETDAGGEFPQEPEPPAAVAPVPVAPSPVTTIVAETPAAAVAQLVEQIATEQAGYTRADLIALTLALTEALSD